MALAQMHHISRLRLTRVFIPPLSLFSHSPIIFRLLSVFVAAAELQVLRPNQYPVAPPNGGLLLLLHCTELLCGLSITSIFFPPAAAALSKPGSSTSIQHLSLFFNIKRFVRTEEKIYIRKPNGGGRLPHDETGRTGAITPIGSIGCCCWIVHSATQFRLLSCTPSLQLARGEAVRASTGALRLIS